MFGADDEVLVAGAGPVGLLAALTLAQKGIRVRIVDRGVWACSHSYALALHPHSLRLLHEFGLARAIIDSSIPVRDIVLYDGTSAMANIELEDDHPFNMVAVLRQDTLETLLEAALEDYGVKVGWRQEVSRIEPQADAVELTLDSFEKESRGYVIAHTEWVLDKSTELRVPFVIGADGYSSRVRRSLGATFQEVGPSQYFAVFEFKSAVELHREMHIALGSETTDVLWPLPDGSVRWSFQLNEHRDTDVENRRTGLLSAGFDIPAARSKDRLLLGGERDSRLDESMLRKLIAERAPWFDGDIGPIVWASLVRFERRMSSTYGSGRVWIAGDAAHLTGPVGVQSMNVGLAEAHDLAGRISRILRDGEPESSLEQYNRRWMAEWKRLHSIDGQLAAGPDAAPWVGRHARGLGSSLPAYGNELAAMASQLGLHWASAVNA